MGLGAWCSRSWSCSTAGGLSALLVSTCTLRNEPSLLEPLPESRVESMLVALRCPSSASSSPPLNLEDVVEERLRRGGVDAREMDIAVEVRRTREPILERMDLEGESLPLSFLSFRGEVSGVGGELMVGYEGLW